MVTYTWNLCSAFNPSNSTHTTHYTSGAVVSHIVAAKGSSWGFGALLKVLTSIMALKVEERVLDIHSKIKMV